MTNAEKLTLAKHACTAVQKRIDEAMLRKEKEFQRLDKAMSDMTSMSNRLQQSLAGLI